MSTGEGRVVLVRKGSIRHVGCREKHLPNLRPRGKWKDRCRKVQNHKWTGLPGGAQGRGGLGESERM